jgi:O-antigen ligase
MTRGRDLVLPAYLALCILLGGASAAGYVANCVLQILAIGLIVAALRDGKAGFRPQGETILTWMLLTGCTVAALQFVPLPLSIWTLLGERSQIAEFAQRTGVTITYPAISLMPHESVKSIVWALPGCAVLIWMLRTRAYQAEYLAWTIVAMTAASLALGTLQIGGGRDSALYFYAITNLGSTTGFFANSNHLATLLLVSLPFITAIVSKLSSRHRANETPLMVGAIGVLLVVLAGIFINRALTGYALVLPVLAASLLILKRLRGARRYALPVLALMVLVGVGLPFLTDEGAAIFGANASLHPGDRRLVFSSTLRAAWDYAPFGSGLGSFREIYRQYQDPLTTTTEYINHAHNDYLELLLETGLFAVVLLALFLAWWFWRSKRIWAPNGGGPFQQAATIASGAILIHSFVDYPLRTAAMSSIFAVCIALIARRTDGEAAPLPSAPSPDGET